ncbi:hypothetical protein ACQCSV_13490 [Pseudarthrobacter sp. S3]|uniref:hypothetical protein n=1 Tax=Pseudarthrobacter sp. S3 TaxID=3418419 RepID=UPI003CF925C6
MEIKKVQRVFGGLADGASFDDGDVVPERFYARVYFDADDFELCGCDDDRPSLRAPYRLDRALSELQGCWAYVPDMEDAR